MTILELRAEYQSLKGSRAFNGWKEDKLIEEIGKLRDIEENLTDSVHTQVPTTQAPKVVSEWDEMSEAERVEEARKINSMEHETITEIAPVWLNGEPYGIIDNKYVTWDEAELIVLQNQKAMVEAKIAKKLVTNS